MPVLSHVPLEQSLEQEFRCEYFLGEFKGKIKQIKKGETLECVLK